jgi:Uncharacterized protein involved in copper resistance
MKDFVLEVCVDSVESALAAVAGGATRLELCSNLMIGGTTPGQFLFEEIRRTCNTKINVLIRPRYGDFCYSDYEFRIIKQEITMFRELGADGVVIGILKPDGTLSREQMQELMEERGSMYVTLHRAFDVCVDPISTLEQAKALGVNSILTSGQQSNCIAGKELIAELIRRSGNDMEILVGGDVNEAAVRELQPFTKAHAFHMSGKEVINSRMEFRKKEVSMGIANVSEYEIWQTKEENIRRVRQLLEVLDL